MGNHDQTLETLITGGFIGAALGALLSKDTEDGVVIGGLLGAAISATLKANEAARKTNIPVYVEENGKLYAIDFNGNKKFIKHIAKPSEKFPEQFKLK